MAARRQWGARIAGAVIFSGALVAIPALTPLRADAPDVPDVSSGSDHPRDDGLEDADIGVVCAHAADVPSGASDTSAGNTSAGIAGESGTETLAVAVTIPATAMIRIDGRGEVTAAWTNTGCAPTSSDEVWLQRPDGSIVRATADDVETLVVEFEWVGDFSVPGVFVDQARAER